MKPEARFLLKRIEQDLQRVLKTQKFSQQPLEEQREAMRKHIKEFLTGIMPPPKPEIEVTQGDGNTVNVSISVPMTLVINLPKSEE